MSAVVIHKGPIPGTTYGHHWFDCNGERYGVHGWPHGTNRGWSYTLCDKYGNAVTEEDFFTLDEIRQWAAWRPEGMPPLGTREQCAACGRTVWLRHIGRMGNRSEHPGAPFFAWRARKGSLWTKVCPHGDNWRDGDRHRPPGREIEYFGLPS